MSILLENLTKRYDGHPVVNNISLEIKDGEFFVLLGSSGSGKTTVLNLIAGLTGLDGGRILLHSRDVTHLPSQQRNVGFVFQNYALFQYMTVAENVEFGLSIRHVARLERRRRSEELLELVGLAGLGNRMPRQLSGGQQQRIALARALAYEPDVLLLDEPLGALDAKIRTELRRTLRDIQRKLGVTTILVTHDQEEAFDLADRLGVMSFGRLLEVGAPRDLYQHPQTEFVATFLGTANLLVGTVGQEGVRVGPLCFPMPENGFQVNEKADEQRVQVLFRPEDVALASDISDLDCAVLGQAYVEEASFAGSYERVRLRLPPVSGIRPIAPPVSFGSSSILVDAIRSPEQANRFPLATGSKAWLGVHRIHALAHPGLNFLLVTNGTPEDQPAIDLGSQIARMSHAQVTLLGYGKPKEFLEPYLVQVRKHLGSEIAAVDVRIQPEDAVRAVTDTVEHKSFDLVVLNYQHPKDITLAEELMELGEYHLLMVPSIQKLPSKVLICVTTGEPAKDDILFAGRLVRHLGADATLLSVIPTGDADSPEYQRAERFLKRGIQTLGLLGVPARTSVRTGPVLEQIAKEMQADEHDLVVIGTPLARSRGNISLDGVASQILAAVKGRPVLLIHSHYVGAPLYPNRDADRSPEKEVR